MSLMAKFVENNRFSFVLYLLKNASTCKTALMSKLTKTRCLTLVLSIWWWEKAPAAKRFHYQISENLLELF